MPRTRKRTVRRFCGDCGYELALDSDGKCPMCARFAQLRLDSIAPQPSEPDSLAREQPPTVAEYRAIMAAQRAKSASTGRPMTVIGDSALRHSAAPAQTAAPPTDVSSVPPEQTKILFTQQSTAPPKDVEARSVAAPSHGNQGFAPAAESPVTPARAERYRAERSRAGLLPSGATVAAILVVVLSGLVGIAVAVFLAWFR